MRRIKNRERTEARALKLKGCPRCNGDIFIDRDIYGWYEQCLQCGYMSDLVSLVDMKEQLAEEEREAVLAS